MANIKAKKGILWGSQEIPIPSGAYLNRCTGDVFIYLDDGPRRNSRRAVIGRAAGETAMYPNMNFRTYFPQEWRRLFGEEVPRTTDEKRSLALRRHIAMWDTIHSCTIVGSSDSSIRDVVPNDLSVILENSRAERIFCNGAASYNLYKKYIFPSTGIEAVKLPSTSPANAAFGMDRLEDEWKILREYV